MAFCHGPPTFADSQSWCCSNHDSLGDRPGNINFAAAAAGIHSGCPKFYIEIKVNSMNVCYVSKVFSTVHVYGGGRPLGGYRAVAVTDAA